MLEFPSQRFYDEKLETCADEDVVNSLLDWEELPVKVHIYQKMQWSVHPEGSTAFRAILSRNSALRDLVGFSVGMLCVEPSSLAVLGQKMEPSWHQCLMPTHTIPRNRHAHTSLIQPTVIFLHQHQKSQAPMLFWGVAGHHTQDGDSKSYFNEAEVAVTVDMIQKLLSFDRARVSVNDIGVIAPYRKQVRFLSDVGEKERWPWSRAQHAPTLSLFSLSCQRCYPLPNCPSVTCMYPCVGLLCLLLDVLFVIYCARASSILDSCLLRFSSMADTLVKVLLCWATLPLLIDSGLLHPDLRFCRSTSCVSCCAPAG